MPAAMMILGVYTFSLDTAAYQSASRTSQYNWPEQARIGRNPQLQFTGCGAETLSLHGVILPTFRGGLKQIDSMRMMAGTGVPLPLIDGLGHVHGFWCITSITEKNSEFLAGGVPQKIEFTLDLKYYGSMLHDAISGQVRQLMGSGVSTLTSLTGLSGS